MPFRKSIRVVWVSATGVDRDWFECPTSEECIVELTKTLLLNSWKLQPGDRIEFINIVQLEKNYEKFV